MVASGGINVIVALLLGTRHGLLLLLLLLGRSCCGCVHVNLHFLFYILFLLLFDCHLPCARRALVRLTGRDASFSFVLRLLLPPPVLSPLCCGGGRCLVRMQVVDRCTQDTHAPATE